MPSARLPPAARVLAVEQRGLITTRQLLEGGTDTAAIRSLVRGGTLFPVLTAVWATIPASELTSTALIRAARLAVGGGTACLASGATLQGLPAPPSRDRRQHLSLPPGTTRHQARGIALHWLALAPDDVDVIDGIPVTTPLRLFLDASRRWSRADAVALLDAALRLGKVTPAELSNLDRRFSSRAKAWASLADPLGESALESHTRLLLIDAGLGSGLVSQHLLRSPGGRPLARLDLAIPASRVGVECDGEGPHGLPEALFRDRHRQDDVHALGWRLVRVTWRDVRMQPADVVRRVNRALAQAS